MSAEPDPTTDTDRQPAEMGARFAVSGGKTRGVGAENFSSVDLPVELGAQMTEHDVEVGPGEAVTVRGVPAEADAPVVDVPTEVAVEAPLKAPVAVVAETPKQWPEPAGDPGDGVRLGRLRDELGHLTDVGTLATVVGLAVEAAVRGGVRPDVIRAVVDAKVQG